MKSNELILIIVTGVLFLLTFASGAWLAQSGKQANYSMAIITVHKLLALLGTVSAGIVIYLLAKR